MLLVHLDKGAEMRRHFDDSLRLLDYPRGQAGEGSVLDGIDRIIPALVAQQHLVSPAILVDRVQVRTGVEQGDREVRSPWARQRGQMQRRVAVAVAGGHICAHSQQRLSQVRGRELASGIPAD